MNLATRDPGPLLFCEVTDSLQNIWYSHTPANMYLADDEKPHISDQIDARIIDTALSCLKESLMQP